MAVNVNVKKLKENATIPTYGTEYAAGADLYACIEEAVTIEAGETKFIGTGIAMEIPEGYAGLIYARSGLSCKRGLAPANKVGVVDADYRGRRCSSAGSRCQAILQPQTSRGWRTPHPRGQPARGLPGWCPSSCR